MPTLLETQRAMLRAILADERDAAVAQIAGGDFSADERLDVYRNNFLSSLTNALRISYPAVHRLVGQDFFTDAAQLFIAAHPPQSAYLNAYGAQFPDFLAQFPPAAQLPYLADVARLEWAVTSALHAQDAESLDAQALGFIADAPPDRLVLIPHPSIALMRFDSPAETIWRAVLADDDGTLGTIDLEAGPEWLMIERTTLGVEITPLAEREWHFAAALFSGAPLQNVLEAHADIEVASILGKYFAAGRFVGFRLTGNHPPNPLENVP